MFLALHHSANAAIHVLVGGCGLTSKYLFSKFLRPIQGENELGLLPLFLCFVEQNKDF